jgi:hypothetical protein
MELNLQFFSDSSALPVPSYGGWSDVFLSNIFFAAGDGVPEA